MTKVKLTMQFPFNAPGKNGIVFTQDAVENALYNAPKNMPIICEDDKCNRKVIGIVERIVPIVIWDSGTQYVQATINGTLFQCEPSIIVNKIKDNEITDFSISSIGVII